MAAVFAAIATAFVALHVVGQHLRWNHDSDRHLITVLSLDAEKNPPALYSAFLLFVAALVLTVIARLESSTRWHHGWWTLAAGFALMSVDETFALHERLIEPVRAMLGAGYPAALHFAWVIPALALVAVLAVWFRSFLRSLPRATRSLFLVAAALYLGGAIGLEMIGGRYLALHGSDMTQSMIATVEEAMEMYGTCLFLYAALHYLADRDAQLQLHFGR